MSKSPFSIAGMMFDVPPPTPGVRATFKPLSCSMTNLSISPRISCSVIGFVAMRMTSTFVLWKNA